MSSIIDRRRSQKGQALVLFTLALIAFLAAAALVFDVGQALADRRARQDAADAAALAGARYVANPSQARAVALEVAADNGFESGVNGIDVTVKIPPGPETNFAGLSGFIEVEISGARPSFFGGVLGISSWNVAALAVAANTPGSAAPYAFLALDPDACGAAQFSGNADVEVAGNIQVNSSCSSAMKVVGNADVAVTIPNGECNVHGDFGFGGNYQLDCLKNHGAPVVPDPLAALPPPPVPQLPADVVKLSLESTLSIPAGCPGGSAPATAENPASCSFTGTYAGTMWRLSPGYYPGGIAVQGGTILLEPGIYYLGGGGFLANGTSAKVYSVDAGATTAQLGGGVLLYNSEDAVFHDQCAAGTAPNAGVDCIQAIAMKGASTEVHLRQLEIGSPWDGLVIFQDRSILPSPTLTINGNGANMDITGTLYVPAGTVQINGNGAMAFTTQVIANQFLVDGSKGTTLDVSYESDSFFQFAGEGLVQ